MNCWQRHLKLQNKCARRQTDDEQDLRMKRGGLRMLRGAVQGPECGTGAVTSLLCLVNFTFILYVRTHGPEILFFFSTYAAHASVIPPGYSYLCFSLQQVTCKSKYDVGVNEDCPQVYDAGVGLPSSGRPRRVWQSHVGCECSLENVPLLGKPTRFAYPSDRFLSYPPKRTTGFFNPDIQWLTASAGTCAQKKLSGFQ